MLKLTKLVFIIFSLISTSLFAREFNEQEFINKLQMNNEQITAFQEILNEVPEESRRDLTVCGSVGGGVILSIDIFRCHDVNNNDYLITFKGYGLSAYAKAGIVYIHSKRPILPGFYRAHEAGFHTGFGGYAIKLKNKQTKFTIRGLTYGIGLQLVRGKAEVKVLN